MIAALRFVRRFTEDELWFVLSVGPNVSRDTRVEASDSALLGFQRTASAITWRRIEFARTFWSFGGSARAFGRDFQV